MPSSEGSRTGTVQIAEGEASPALIAVGQVVDTTTGLPYTLALIMHGLAVTSRPTP